MATNKPRVVIVGAGMAGLTAANKLYTSVGAKDLFELRVVEGGSRIGGRINTSEFCGDRIELGATWIHGIGGSPVYEIAREIDSLRSEQPWECMDGFLDDPVTAAEGGYEVDSSIFDPISGLFDNLMNVVQGKKIVEDDGIRSEAVKNCLSDWRKDPQPANLSVGCFLRRGLNAYWDLMKDEKEANGLGGWSRKSLEEAIFAMHENTQRTYTAADDLEKLDFAAESEYQLFPGEEITIPKGYLSVIEWLASVLPVGLIQLGKKVRKIEWQPEGHRQELADVRPVKLHFSDGSIISADHVIVTVSLGVLKHGISEHNGMFDPPLPNSKIQSISRLGYGVVDKLFLQLSPPQDDDQGGNNNMKFPFLQMVFHQPGSKLSHAKMKIPSWVRRTASLSPIYRKSNVVLAWFSGKEALELESLDDEEIIDGVSKTVSNLLSHSQHNESRKLYNNGMPNSEKISATREVKFGKVLKSKWGADPLFLGSYSYVSVGSSGDDIDTLAEPLPESCSLDSSSSSSSNSSYTSSSSSSFSSAPLRLQILFAGEATDRTHYSTTHGAYLSGLREANRLLRHYNLVTS